MSEPYLPKSNRLKFLLLGSVVGVTAFAVAIIVGTVVTNFSNYQDSGGQPSGDAPPVQVSFSNLWNGLQLEAGESLLVNATAIGPQAFLSMELWVDGQLAGVQAAPGGGVHPFSAFFSWLPIEPGSHSLIAAAVDTEGNKAMSAQVVVFVTQTETDRAAALPDPDVSPVVQPAPGGSGYIPPSPPGADAAVGAANGWSGSPGDWINSLTADESPAAPELVADPQGCAAELLIHDLSDNEEGFLIYKEDSYSPDWVQVAALSANSQPAWISFTDGGLPGTVTYYVSAFNDQGQADSNLATVKIDPADCPPELGVSRGYSLQVNKLFPEVETELVYCYQSTNGVDWSRWPVSGFLPRDDEGFVIGGPVVNVLNPGFLGEEMTPRSGMDLVCWGWSGGNLVQIGHIFVEKTFPVYLGNQLVPGEGIHAEIEFKPIYLVGEPHVPVSTAGIDLMPAERNHNLLQTSNSPVIPQVWLHQTIDPEVCRNYLPPHAQNAQGQAAYCFVYPEFGLSQGTGVVQPYLHWDFGEYPTCLEGIGESCLNYSQLLALAEASGGMVGFQVSSSSNAGTFTWSVTEPDLRAFVVPPLSCTGSANYRVRLWYRPGPKAVGFYTADEFTGPEVYVDKSNLTEDDQPVVEIDKPTFSEQDQPAIEPDTYTVGDAGPQAVVQEVYYGMPSNIESVPCDPKVAFGTVVEPTQYLDITFQSIEFFEIDDDDVVIDAPQDVELYGYFRVKAPAMGKLIDAPCFFDLFCDENGQHLAYTRRAINIADWEGHDGEQYCPGCTVRVESGLYDLADWAVCQSTNKYSCIYEGQDSQYMTNNNTIRVFVKDGDALDIEIRLVDYDEGSDHDSVCYTGELLPARSLAEWANVSNEPLAFNSNMTTSGRCNVEAVINAVNP